MKKLLLCLCVIFINVHGIVFAQNERYAGLSPDEKTPFMPAAKTGALENGLRYYILENKMPASRAFIHLVVNAGSVLEEENERGLAHFVEHMAFNGTRRFPETELIDYLRSLGMRFGADLNAYTSFDETVYQIETPVETNSAGKKIIPRKALEIFDDWTHAILFAEKDVNEERAIIVEEKRSRGGVGARMQDVFLPLVFAGTPYAQRLPIGLMEVVETAPAARLKNFYTKWYRPENMALIFVGDFDAETLQKSLSSIFTAPKTEGDFTRPVSVPPPPVAGKTSARVWTDSELTSTMINLLYKQPWKASGGDVRTYHARALDSLIDIMVNSRFNTLTFNPASPFTHAGGGLSRFVNTLEMYVFRAEAKDGRAREALAALLAEKEKIVRFGFTQAELARAKFAVRSSFERFYNERDKRASSGYVSEFTEHFLRNVEAPGIEWEREVMQKILDATEIADVNEHARGYFQHDDAIVFISAPAEDAPELPDEAELALLVRNAPLAELSAPEDEGVDGELLDGEPAPGAIVRQSVDKASGARVLVLSNGARVILRETANKDDDITLYAIAKGGTANVPPEDVVSSRFAGEILAASGLGRWTRDALIKRLTGRQVSIGFSPSAYTRTLQGNATRASLETLFQLVYLEFTSPRLDDDALRIVKDSWTVDLKKRSENPDQVFGDELRRILYGDDPRFNPMRLADLPDIDIQTARAFIESALNPADWTFVFVGNIHEQTIKPFIEQY
ncbi:MAG: insulinase family protein, partial [Spirochaetaceae bacterium]|nr:insulinase family protein [Spirochaetaceae bacterium]